MKAYHNKPEIKAQYLERVRAHQEADQIVKGQYWAAGKGCAVGCTIHGSQHNRYETELGVPEVLARLEDGIFEGLPNGKALAWPEQFLSAIKVGADLSRVGDRFLHWLLVDETDGVIQFAKTEKTRQAIQTVGDLYARKIKGEIISVEVWRKAAASDAASAAAYASAYAAASAAAYDAASASASDAASDAASAAAYTSDAKRSIARVKQAEKLIELLKAA